jgi:MinD-like ATPase involved in chromosome partitioning or flagellar assembly
MHSGGGQPAMEQLLTLPPSHVARGHPGDSPVACRGYQGVDLVSSRIPLSSWGRLETAQLDGLVRAHEMLEDYDDVLIDTSDMSPQTVVRCACLSGLVLLVVTPDPGSLAAAFALLKVLRLNDFTGEVRLVANRVESEVQARALQEGLSTQTRRHLDTGMQLLGALSHDRHVLRAERLRQAVTSLYPDSPFCTDLVRLADALEKFTEGRTLQVMPIAAFWSAYADSLGTPVRITGGGHMEEAITESAVEPAAALVPEGADATASLLRFEGPLSRLDQVMQGFSSVMHVVANDMSLLHEHLADLEALPGRAAEWTIADSAALEVMLARVLNVLLRELTGEQPVCFQVEESRVSGGADNWLRAGHYVRYVFLVPGQSGTAEAIGNELARLPGLRRSTGPEGECICELISAARDACLSVVNTPQGEIRVNFWHPSSAPAGSQAGRRAGDIPVERLQEQPVVHKRLH